MTAPEVFQVRDGDGWEVYVTNPAGGWWLLGSVGGSAVVDTVPDRAERMGRVCAPMCAEGGRRSCGHETMRGPCLLDEGHGGSHAADFMVDTPVPEGGDRRG